MPAPDPAVSQSDYPYVDTAAARMLWSGLQQRMARSSMSMRQIGKELGYKQAVVLSHMASGRVPIPIDRANDFAVALDLDPRSFLSAVLVQRHPDVDWAMLRDDAGKVDRFSILTELTAGRTIDELTPGQRKVIREAASDIHAERRWLSPHELSAVEQLRTLRPSMQQHGLGRADHEAIATALKIA